MKRKDKNRQTHSVKFRPIVRTWLEDHEYLNKGTGRRTKDKSKSLNALLNDAVEEYFQRRSSDQASLIFLQTRKRILDSHARAIITEKAHVMEQEERLKEELRLKKIKAATTTQRLTRLGLPTPQKLEKVKESRGGAS